MMNHIIKNQNGKYVYGKEQVGTIYNMLHNGREESMVEGKKITVLSDKRKDGERETVVHIEGI